MRLCAALLASLFTLSIASAAEAQTPPAERRALLEQARASSGRGDHAEALRIGEAAAGIQMTPSLQMFLAEEHEALTADESGGGHLLAAVGLAEACVRDANAQPALNNREWILHRCTALVTRLNPRIARVRVEVPPPVPAVTRVRVAGRELTAAEWNSPVEVVPGEVVVEASAEGRGLYRRVVIARAGAHETVTVVWPEVPAVTQRPARTGDGSVANERAAASGVRAGPSRTGQVAGWSLVGVGVVAGAVGVWQWVASSEQASQSFEPTTAEGAAWERYARRINGGNTLTIEAGCERARADAATNADAASFRDACDANERSIVMAYAFGIGGAVVALGGAALVVLTRPGSGAEGPRVSVAPWVTRGVGGVVVGGTF